MSNQVPVTATAFKLSLDQSTFGLHAQYASNVEIIGIEPYHLECGW
jgi:hypothetical protein